MSKHLRLKHNNRSPSQTKQMEEIFNSKINSKYKCHECDKSYFDKSTLNRHMKKHLEVNSNLDIKQHHGSPSKNNKVPNSNIVSNTIIQKKCVLFADNLTEVKEIPITKLNIKNKETEVNMKQMFNEIEKIMQIYSNRCQLVTVSELVIQFEQITHKTFDNILFRGLLSVYPEAYSVKVIEKDRYLFMEGEKQRILPSTLKKREDNFKDLFVKLKEDGLYVDLILLDEPKQIQYKSAKQVIKDNVAFIVEDFLENTQIKDNKKRLSFIEILGKVKENSEKKKKREEVFSQIDWQGDRVKYLARYINNAFLSERRSCIKKDRLFDFAINSGYSSSKIEKDFIRLINHTNGWISNWRGWCKRNSKTDINKVIQML